MNMLRTSTAEIVMGHLEIKGVEMQNGVINEHGNEKADFKRFERVISGHFHKHSDDDPDILSSCSIRDDLVRL